MPSDFAINEDALSAHFDELNRRANTPGSSPTNPLNEQPAGTVGLRALGMNLGTPEGFGRLLQERFGPGNVRSRGGYDFLVKDTDGLWKTIDPSGLDFQDFLDIGGDLFDATVGAVSGAAGAVAGPLGAIGAAGAGSAAARGALLGVGQLLGLENEGAGREVGISAIGGAGGEALALGAGALRGSIRNARIGRLADALETSRGGTRAVAAEALEEGAEQAGERFAREVAEEAVEEGATIGGFREVTEEVVRPGARAGADFVDDSLAGVSRPRPRPSLDELGRPTGRVASQVPDEIAEAVGRNTRPAARPKPAAASANTLVERQIAEDVASGFQHTDTRAAISDQTLLSGSQNQVPLVAISREDPTRQLTIISSPPVRSYEQFQSLIKDSERDAIAEGLEYWTGKPVARDLDLAQLEGMVEKIKPELIQTFDPIRRARKREAGLRDVWVLRDTHRASTTSSESAKFKKWKTLDVRKWDIVFKADQTAPLDPTRHRIFDDFFTPETQAAIRNRVAGRSPQVPTPSPQRAPGFSTITQSPGIEQVGRDLGQVPPSIQQRVTGPAPPVPPGTGQAERARFAQLGARIEDLGNYAGNLVRDPAMRVGAFVTGNVGPFIGVGLGGRVFRGVGKFLQEPGVLENLIPMTRGAAREKLLGLLKMLRAGNANGFSAALHVVMMDPVAGELIRSQAPEAARP